VTVIRLSAVRGARRGLAKFDTAIQEIVTAAGKPHKTRPRSPGMTSPRDRVLEAELESWVADLAAHLYLLRGHTHRSEKSPEGVPDDIIVGRRVIWRELKTEYGTLTAAQQTWGAALLEAGEDWAVWRPCHWFPSSDHPRGLIRTELESITFKIGE
jgi:hypothetical protein